VVSDVVVSMVTTPDHPELLHCLEVSLAYLVELLSCLVEMVG
jgi:hypothetical protein